MILDNVIAGSGFSAYCIHNLVSSEARNLVVSPLSHGGLNGKFIRQRQFDLNRPLARSARSLGRLAWDIGPNQLVDRIGLGGNSNVWGGYIDLDEANGSLLAKLKGASVVKLNPGLHGLGSNKNIGILTGDDGRIFNSGNYFSGVDGYLDAFVSKIDLERQGLISLEVETRTETIRLSAKKLFLCLSVPQLIELLANSGLFPDHSVLKLLEHEFYFARHTGEPEPDACVISYRFWIAVGRALGARNLNYGLLNIGPYVVDQVFKNRSAMMELLFQRSGSGSVTLHNDARNFGKSIHYYGLSVNDKEINSVLREVNPGIQVLGHASIYPQNGGPVSNCILNGAGLMTANAA